MNNFFYDLNKKMADLATKQDLSESRVAESEKWIQKAINPAHKGDLHKALHVAPGEKIPKAKINKATHSKNPKLRHMAQFAKNVANEEQLDELSVNKLNDIKGSANRIARDERMSGGDETRANKAERVAGKASVRANDKVQAGMKANQGKGIAEVVRTTDAYGDAPETQSDRDMLARNVKYARQWNGNKGSASGTGSSSFSTGSKVTNRPAKADAKFYQRSAAPANQGKGVAEGHCSKCAPAPCSCNEGNAFTDKLKATAKGGKFKMGNKEYTDTSDIEEGAFKNLDIERQEQEIKKSRHNPGNSPLRQVPGVQNIKPRTKENPLKNVGKGFKAFVKGEPEPMDEVVRVQSTYYDKGPDSQSARDSTARHARDARAQARQKDPTARGATSVNKPEVDNGWAGTPGVTATNLPANAPRRLGGLLPGKSAAPANQGKGVAEEKKAKPDYPDIDHDGNRKESMKKAAADKTRSTGTAFDPEARKKSKTDQEGTGNFDKKKVSTGTVYTRRHKEDDEEVTSNEPKRKGRPKGPAKGPERTTAKAWKHKGSRAVKENDMEGTHDPAEQGEFGQEGDYVKNELHTMVRVARDLERHLRDNEDLPTWCIGKLSQAKGMVVSVMDYIMSEKERGIEADRGEEGIRIAEKAVSVKQRRAAGIAHAAQKGEIPKSKLRGASKAMAKMPEKELDKFASTKEKGLPKKVKETTTAGSVATGGEAPKSTKGMSFGKGVYEGAISESYNKKLNSVLNEGMNVTVNMNGQGQKSVNVSADGEDAEKLAEILKLAGLGGQSGGCSSCGQSSCGCETVDEAYGDATATKNNPDWPTDTETVDADDPHLRRFSGGLNGAKSTGQTTVPVIAGQLRRQASMEENVKLERSLFDTWKTYKGQ